MGQRAWELDKPIRGIGVEKTEFRLNARRCGVYENSNFLPSSPAGCLSLIYQGVDMSLHTIGRLLVPS